MLMIFTYGRLFRLVLLRLLAVYGYKDIVCLVATLVLLVNNKPVAQMVIFDD